MLTEYAQMPWLAIKERQLAWVGEGKRGWFADACCKSCGCMLIKIVSQCQANVDSGLRFHCTFDTVDVCHLSFCDC